MSNDSRISNAWYSFFFCLADCGHAAIIRCFLSPAYLPILAKESGMNRMLSPNDWTDYLEDKLYVYPLDEAGHFPAKKILKQRIKGLGTFFCDSVNKDYKLNCSSYLGKNRNVMDFPERYFQAVFPVQKNLAPDAIYTWNWYENLLSVLYQDLPKALSDLLTDLRSLNRTTDWLHVPEITPQATDPFFADASSAAYLLSSFALLSSARQTELEDKNGLLAEEKTGIFRQIQNLLEVPVEEDRLPDASPAQAFPLAVSDGTMLSVPLFDFLTLCTAALTSPDYNLLQSMYQMTLHFPAALPFNDQTTAAARKLLSQIQSCESDVLQRIYQNNAADLYNATKELNCLVELEKYWAGVLECV